MDQPAAAAHLQLGEHGYLVGLGRHVHHHHSRTGTSAGRLLGEALLGLSEELLGYLWGYRGEADVS